MRLSKKPLKKINMEAACRIPKATNSHRGPRRPGLSDRVIMDWTIVRVTEIAVHIDLSLCFAVAPTLGQSIPQPLLPFALTNLRRANFNFHFSETQK